MLVISRIGGHLLSSRYCKSGSNSGHNLHTLTTSST